MLKLAFLASSTRVSYFLSVTLEYIESAGIQLAPLQKVLIPLILNAKSLSPLLNFDISISTVRIPK
jgi:hypothetical protein